MIAVIIAVGIIASSCMVRSSASTNTQLATEIVDEQAGLKFVMSLQKDTFSIGEPVNITFAVTNISNETIMYLHRYPEFDFIVCDSLGHSLFRWIDFKAFPMVIWGECLNPGESYGNVLVWPQTCYRTGENNDGVPVSPGQYVIVGLFVNRGLQTSPLRVSIGTEVVPVIVVVGVVGVGIAAPLLAFVAAALTRRR